MTDEIAARRIFEFAGVLGETIGWIEVEGEAVHITHLSDDGEPLTIEFPREMATDVAEAIRMAAP